MNKHGRSSNKTVRNIKGKYFDQRVCRVLINVSADMLASASVGSDSLLLPYFLCLCHTKPNFNILKTVYSRSKPGQSNNYEIINNFHFFVTSCLQLYKGLPRILEGSRVNMIIQTNIYLIE